MTPIRKLVLAVLCFLLLATPGLARERKLSSELNEHLNRFYSNAVTPQTADTVEVIIQFRRGATLPALLNKVKAIGGSHRNTLDVIHGGLFRVPVDLLPILAQDPDITYISPDRQTFKLSPGDYILDATVTNPVINLGYTGVGIGVAVIDSGVKSNHPDFQNTSTGYSRVVYSQSFISGLDASDQYGHGTHVAGLIAGNGAVSGGWMRGVAQRANIINLRVLDANGAGTDSAVIAAIQRAIQLKNTYNIRVINISLGRRVSESYTLDPVCQAVEQAWKAGIVVVVAAGNYGRDNSMNTNGYATITVPGNDPYVITVGALNTHGTQSTSDDTITSYSSKGPTLLDHVIKPDLLAPGNRVVSLLSNGSTLDKGYPSNEVSPSAYGSYSSTAAYTFLSGTSMASPIVSGAVALLLESNPYLTPDQVKGRLMKNATKVYPSYSRATGNNGATYNSQNDVFAVGAGVLNTYAALNTNEAASGNSLSPVATRDQYGNVSLSPDRYSFWSNSVVWGESVVWGNSLLNGSSVVWGDSVVWGESTLSGYSVVWGESVWGATSTNNAFSEASTYDQN